MRRVSDIQQRRGEKEIAQELNQIIASKSQNSSLVITNLPPVRFKASTN